MSVEIDVTEACQALPRRLAGFTIRLELPLRYYQGLEAIDLCRKYSLPESANIRTNGSTQFTIGDEGFLRAWFPSDANNQLRIVELDWLTPGEVTIHSGDIDIAASSAFTPERAQSLFIRAEFEILRRKLAVAQGENVQEDEEEA